MKNQDIKNNNFISPTLSKKYASNNDLRKSMDNLSLEKDIQRIPKRNSTFY